MAEYLIQDTTLTAIGDAIRAKEESTGPIPVPDFAARIAAIQTGINVQRATGSFTTNSSGSATVNCGFQPDVVVVTKGETYDGSNFAAAIPFSDYVGKTLGISLFSISSDVLLYSFTSTQTATGFSVKVEKMNYSMSSSNASNTQFSYIAYKFTE